MDTKSKGWTAVRIICFVLILVLCFTAVSRLLSVAVTYEETNIHPEIVFANLSTMQFFFERHVNMHMIFQSLDTMARFKSEEAIRAGEYLMWFEYTTVFVHDSYGYGYSRPFDFNHFSNTDPDSAHTAPGFNTVQRVNESGGWFTWSDDADWEFNEEYPNEIYVIESWLQLGTPDKNGFYASILLTDLTTLDELYMHEANAKRDQLFSYQSAQNYLNQIEGLLYYLSVETTSADDSGTAFAVYSNVHESQRNAEFFKSFPVYFIMSRSDFGSSSRTMIDSTSNIYSIYGPQFAGAGELFLAFTSEAVDAHNQIYSAARNTYIRDFTAFAASAILALGLMIVLMVAAGRKYKAVAGEQAQTNKVHFIPVDKPYLDISLAMLVGWSVLVVYFTLITLTNIWHYMNVAAMNMILLAAVLLIVPFTLVWLTSFAKHIRAGKFWRHSLIYIILYRCILGSLRVIFRFTKSLWAGTRLSFKVAVISCAAFFTMFFVGLIGVETRAYAPLFLLILLITAVITVLLLMYARRIRKLEQGARDAAQGKYYPPIAVGSGELGTIAHSINNISTGINTAVEERMKSERLKTELITNVSHDIRTPLTSIITYTDLLEHEGLDCEKAPEYLEILKQKSLRLKTLTDELFEAAKAATGNIDVNLVDLNIVSLLNQVLGELDNAVKSSGLDLRVNLPEKLHAVADGRLMQRVMENLLSNVFKYSLPGSRVYLDAVQADASYVRIELKNISSQELNFDPSELTERFKRGDDSRADGGSGLGLSIVQSFMDAQGGRFYVSIDGDLFKATVLLPAPVLQPES